MRIACPICKATVDVADGAAGTRAECPLCYAEISVPAGVGTAASARPGDKSPADVVSAGRSPSSGTGRMCYLVRCSDEGNVRSEEAQKAVRALLSKVPEILEAEELGYEYTIVGEGAIPGLNPDDMAVLVAVTKFGRGSQFVRYFVPLLALLGVGDCKMSVGVAIRRGDGSKEFHGLKARQFMGVFGGSSRGLMDVNVKAIAKALAAKIARRRVLNATAYRYALASLILGLLGFVPVLGLILFLPGLILGAVSLAVISKRGLRKRKTIAIIGLILNLIAPAASIFTFMLLVL